MGSIGYGEILLVILIAILLFGPEKLPELARALAKSIKEFKSAEDEVKNVFKGEPDLKEQNNLKEQEESIKRVKDKNE